MVIVSVDLGRVNTGIAACDKSEIIASPVGVIKERNYDKLAEKIDVIVKERSAELIVMGLPKNMDGSEGESAINAREFGEKLSTVTGLEVQFLDERGTTITAHNYLNITDTRGKKRKQTVDSVAAVIILEDFLRSRKR